MNIFTRPVILAMAMACSMQMHAQRPAGVFLTAGQSNADGREYVSKLPSYLKNGYRHLKFANVTSSADGTFGQRTFDNPKGRFAFCDITNYFIEQAEQRDFYAIKCAYGGTAIDTAATYAHLPVWCADASWISRQNAYRGDIETGKSLTKSLIDGFDRSVDVTLSKLDGGYDVKAIMWHQGESDRSKGGHYYKNFKDMINYMRQAVYEKTGREKDLTLPFIFGTISHKSKQYSPAVEQAQMQVARELENVFYIDMSDASLRSDALHFDSASTDYLGRMMYNKLVELKLVDGKTVEVNKPEKPDPTDTITVDVERAWDFTRAWSDETVDSIKAAGSKWEAKGSMGYRYSSAMNTMQQLATAGGYVFPETKGLYFESNTGNRIYVNPGKNLCFYADNLLLTLPRVQPGQTVTIVTASAKGERGLTTDNGDELELLSGGVKSTKKVVNSWKVKESVGGPVDLVFHSNGGGIYVYSIEVASPPTVQILVGADRKVMFSSDKSCEVKTHSDLIKAYVATGYDRKNNVIILEQVDTIPANTGVLVTGEEALVEAKVVDEAPEAGTNCFRPVLSDTVIAPSAADDGYTLFCLRAVNGNADFYRIDGCVALEAGTGYLRLPAADVDGKDMILSEERSSTGISTARRSDSRKTLLYSLDGRRVCRPTGNIYILNGKKYVKH